MGTRATQRLGSQRGTASVELVGVLPGLIVAVLVATQLAAVGFAVWSAGIAARAGARSALIGDDAEAVARRALPGVLRSDADVTDEEDVSVEVVIPRVLPVLPKLRIAAHASLEAEDEG